MQRRVWPWVIIVSAIAVAGCFSPREAPCAFTCISAAKLCPEAYVCGDDGLCHRVTTPGDEGVCLLNAPDAGSTAAFTDDASVD